MVSLVSELTSYGWKNEWIRGSIRSSALSPVVVAGVVLFRALLTVCLSIVSIVRVISWCKSARVMVPVILSVFVCNSTPFSYLFDSFSERLCKPGSRWGYVLEFETAENRTFLVILATKIMVWKKTHIDPNLITSWGLGVNAKYHRREGLFAVANTYESDPKRRRAIDTALPT